MAAFDTVIRHGTIATASDTFRADLAIRDGRIVAIGESLDDADDVVDAVLGEREHRVQTRDFDLTRVFRHECGKDRKFARGTLTIF